ncbi:MAG: type 4a pilus biogenesis protein PilO [Planctomycetota bacterium]
MSELQQQIPTLRKRQRKLLGVIAAILVLFYFGVFRTANGQLDRIVGQVHVVDQELELNQQQIEALPEIAEEVHRLRKDLSRTQHELPGKPDVTAFWGAMGQLSDKLSLRDFQFQQQATQTIPVDGDVAVGVQPVRITFKGDFASGFTFLRQMESYPKALHVRNTSIKRLTAGGDTSFELWVNLYYRTDAAGRS